MRKLRLVERRNGACKRVLCEFTKENGAFMRIVGELFNENCAFMCVLCQFLHENCSFIYSIREEKKKLKFYARFM